MLGPPEERGVCLLRPGALATLVGSSSQPSGSEPLCHSRTRTCWHLLVPW